MTSKSIFSLALAAAFAFGLAGCGQPQQAPADAQSAAEPGAEAAAEKTIRIGVMPKLIGIDYFNAAETGVKEAAAALGVEVDYDGPVEPDVTRQVQMIDTWITRRYDAICVAPNDPTPSATSSKAPPARRQGHHWDTDAQLDARDFVNRPPRGHRPPSPDIAGRGVGPRRSSSTSPAPLPPPSRTPG